MRALPAFWYHCCSASISDWLRRRQAEVDDHRGAAGKRGGGAGIEIVGGEGAHEGHLHVRVRIDAAGHHVAAGGVDDMVGVVVEIGADGDDLVVLDEDVGLGGEIGGDDRAAFDEFGHVGLSRCSRLIRGEFEAEPDEHRPVTALTARSKRPDRAASRARKHDDDRAEPQDIQHGMDDDQLVAAGSTVLRQQELRKDGE